MAERTEQRCYSPRLSWGSRVRDTMIVLIGAGMAVAPGGVASERFTAGTGIATVGIIAIIRGLRELRKPENQRRTSCLY